MLYADQTLLIADYIPEAKSAGEIAAVGRILASVSAFVDTHCKRVPGYFSPAAEEPSDKRVRGEGQHFLRLPVHVFGSIESVKILGSTIDSANYYESDRNGWLYREEGAWSLEQGLGNQNIWEDGRIYTVKARWGYEATPADLSEAVRQTVKAIWERQKGVLGEVSPEGFVIERAMPLFARDVLDRYKRREFEI